MASKERIAVCIHTDIVMGPHLNLRRTDTRMLDAPAPTRIISKTAKHRGEKRIQNNEVACAEYIAHPEDHTCSNTPGSETSWGQVR